MKKNQIILIVFAVIIIMSGVFYYQIVDLEEGQLAQVGDLDNKEDNIEDNKADNKNNVVEKDVITNKDAGKENNKTEVKQPEKVEKPVSNNGDLSICNENGRIPILMYYKFAETNESNDEWTRTFAEFKKDLKLLYDNNYRPISMTDYVTGNINVPYGMTPVVLTFDDGHAGQLSFKKDEAGNLVVKEKTAVAAN